MSTLERLAVGFIPLVILFAVGLGLMQFGVYGWTLFALLPVFLGAAGVFIVRPSTPSRAARLGALILLAACASLLLLGREGVICLMTAIPLVVPLGALGGWFAFRLLSANAQPSRVSLTLLLPLATFAWDTQAPPPVFQVRTQVVVHATPAQVWKNVVSFADVPEPTEWFFHIGLAYPKRARIEGSGPGAVRYCEFSTGPFVEPITIWDEPHLLRFRVSQNPAPLVEWSPLGPIRAKHLHGYLVSQQGQFRLTALLGGRTLLEGTTWYRHSLWPAQYWRWWSDAIIHRIHLRVMNHVRALSEQEGHS